jgi:hypothetical protein
MWTVRLLAEDVYRPAPDGTLELAALPDTGWHEVRILGANIQRLIDVETAKYSSAVVRSVRLWSTWQIELSTWLYRFPDDELDRRSLEDELATRRYLWLDWGNYPGRLCPATHAQAVELAMLEVEHAYEAGGKFLRIQLLTTRR